MSEQPIELGQVWERLTDGTRYRITATDPFFDDHTFHVLGQSRYGSIYGWNLRKRYRLIDVPD